MVKFIESELVLLKKGNRRDVDIGLQPVGQGRGGSVDPG